MHCQSIFKNKRKYDFLKSTTLRWSSLTNSSGSEWKGKYVKIWWERKSVEGECKRACPTGFDPLWFCLWFPAAFHHHHHHHHIIITTIIIMQAGVSNGVWSSLISRCVFFPIPPPTTTPHPHPSFLSSTYSFQSCSTFTCHDNTKSCQGIKTIAMKGFQLHPCLEIYMLCI